ncbi:hypothetical protein I3679_001880 [Proteus mirabilis]|uniref:Uncharacterized protein n=1 Tax=Proteus mirabilis TaxID=584 RepID=A0ABD5LU76_PROMI
MRNPEFTLYNNKSLKYQHITTISNKIFKEPENTDITNDDSHNKNNLDKIKKKTPPKKQKSKKQP